MRGQHFYSCLCCGKQDSCGDCIPTYCGDCDRKIRTCHNGQVPMVFGTDYENCPCSDCRTRKTNESLIEKLIAHSQGLETERDAAIKRAEAAESEKERFKILFEDAEKRIFGFALCAEGLTEERDAAQSESARLQEAVKQTCGYLSRYGGHDANRSVYSLDCRRCDCGLTNALQKAREALSVGAEDEP